MENEKEVIQNRIIAQYTYLHELEKRRDSLNDKINATKATICMLQNQKAVIEFKEKKE